MCSVQAIVLDRKKTVDVFQYSVKVSHFDQSIAIHYTPYTTADAVNAVHLRYWTKNSFSEHY